MGRVAINRYTRLPEEVTLSKKLSSNDVLGVYGHEIGQLAGEIPVEGLTREVKALYNVGNNPNNYAAARMTCAWILATTPPLPCFAAITAAA